MKETLPWALRTFNDWVWGKLIWNQINNIVVLKKQSLCSSECKSRTKDEFWIRNRLRIASSRDMILFFVSLTAATIPIINLSLWHHLVARWKHIVIKSVLYPFYFHSHCSSCLPLPLFPCPCWALHLLFIQTVFSLSAGTLDKILIQRSGSLVPLALLMTVPCVIRVSGQKREKEDVFVFSMTDKLCITHICHRVFFT